MTPRAVPPRCVTCNLPYTTCPGHMGHIDLSMPMYNPTVFGNLFKLMRCATLTLTKNPVDTPATLTFSSVWQHPLAQVHVLLLP